MLCGKINDSLILFFIPYTSYITIKNQIITFQPFHHLISSFGYLSSLFLPPFEERFLSSKSGSNCFQSLSLVSLMINDRLFKLPFLKISHFFVHPQHQFLSSSHPLPLPGIQALRKIPPNASHFDPIVNELLLILQ